MYVCMHACMHAACMHACMHAYIHTYIRQFTLQKQNQRITIYCDQLVKTWFSLHGNPLLPNCIDSSSKFQLWSENIRYSRAHSEKKIWDPGLDNRLLFMIIFN